jgi:glutamate 5-kinase
MSQTIVVKIGTSSLTRTDTGQLALSTIASLVEVLCRLQQDHRVILVSSGAVGIGCGRLGLAERPQQIALKQAIAAVGQGRLIRIYDDFFTSLAQPIAQILLTRGDLTERSRYLNIFQTFRELLNLGVIPVVNENDTVAVEELKFGDNDTLSALVAGLVQADWLFLLTDVDGLYSADPRQDPAARPIPVINTMEELTQLGIQATGRGSQWGTGGMATKISAAQIATESGVRTVITHGQHPERLIQILNGSAFGTQFAPKPRPFNARQRWIVHGLLPIGKLYLDAGAVIAVRDRGKSLLAAGITKVEGDFSSQDAVQICTPDGDELARGLVNYSSWELQQIQGLKSEKIPDVLGYESPETVVHRDNLVLSERV